MPPSPTGSDTRTTRTRPHARTRTHALRIGKLSLVLRYNRSYWTERNNWRHVLSLYPYYPALSLRLGAVQLVLSYILIPVITTEATQ